MKAYGAKGFCAKCQKFDSIRNISDRNDAVGMLVHFHGVDARHCFDGDIEVYEYEEEGIKAPETKISDVAMHYNDKEELDRPKKAGKPTSPTLHHIRPQSRGGKDGNNLVTLPEKFHQALHTMFGNLTPEESVRFIEEVLMPGKKWTNATLEQLRNLIKEG